MKTAKFALASTILAAAMSLALGFLASTTQAANCVARPDHRDCQDPPAGEEVTLNIDYDFDGQMTSISATGVVECVSGQCVFTASDSIGLGTFLLPSSLWDLLDGTFWHKDALNPDACFGFSGSSSTGEALITRVDLVIANSAQEGDTWRGTVEVEAADISGNNVERVYQFQISGPCDDPDPDNCDTAAGAAAFQGLSVEGQLDAIWSSGPDKKKGTPCRCTNSSDPPCPGSAVIPISVDAP